MVTGSRPPAAGVDLTPYVPRVALHWDRERGAARHASVAGTMVFADVSGFTRLSERLAVAGGRRGAEQMTEVIDRLFDELLAVAVGHGGEMLKYGGDAVLVLFRGDHHAADAVAAALGMQARLAEIGRVETGAGVVRMRMSVGIHTGSFDLFLVGSSHRELVVGGPAASRVIEVEGVAAAGEVLVSAETAAALTDATFGAERDGFRVVRRVPARPRRPPVEVDTDVDVAQFVPVGLRDRLRAGAVEPEHRLVTQAFVHVSGLDDALARDGGEVAAGLLHDTLSVIQDACDRYGVTFLATDIAGNGTKAILVAGAPVAVERMEARVLAALSMVVAAGCPLAVRAGVHCGHVFVGEVGPRFRRTYTTIGDVTNTAARVMARAAGGEVLTLASVAEALRATHRFVELDPFVAKGKAEPLVPFRLDGGLEESGNEPDEPARAIAFTGRRHELDTAVEAAAAGRTIDVVGEAGLGKTRLVAELVERLGMPCRRLACESYETSTPFFVIGHLLRAVLGADATGDLPRLRRAVERHRPELAPWVPLVADALDLDADETPETGRLDARFRRQRTGQVIVELLASVIEEPTVLVFDDVHWADESSAEVLAQLGAATATSPWTMVVARRPDGAGHVPDGAAVCRIELEPLDDTDGAAFIAAASAGRPLPPHRIARLVEHGGGNPLFLESLLGLDLDDDLEELPETIEAVVASEIDRLPDEGRRVVRLASVHGASFTYGLLVETARVEDIPLPDDGGRAVSQITRGALVRERDGRLSFRHHVLRDVAYATLPYRLRRRLHGHAADVMLADHAEADDRVGVLAIHEWHARRFASCWRHSVQAGARAVDKHAPAEAAIAFRRALDAARASRDVVDDEELAFAWERYGDALAMTGDAALAPAAYKQARRLTASPVAEGRLCFREARLAEVGGNRARARRWLRRGLAVIGVDADHDSGAARVAADLLVSTAWTAAQEGRFDEAAAAAWRAVEVAEPHGIDVAVADAYVILDDVLVATGRETEATHTAAALNRYDAAGAVLEKASALNNLGVRAHNRGAWDEALRFYDEAKHANLAAGNVTDAGFQAYNVAELLIDQGRFEPAETLLDDLDLLWQSVQFDVGLIFARGLRGVLEQRRGRADEAMALLDDARRRLHDAGLRAYALPFDLAAAEARLVIGDHVGTADAIVDARRSARAATTPGADAALLRLEGLLAIARREISQGRNALVASVAAARAAGARYDLLVGLCALRQTMHPSPARDAVDDEVEQLRSRLDVVADRVPVG